jgi:hypothetical protein
MRVAQEMLTVFVDSDTREVGIVLAGLRITLTPDETASLTKTLLSSLERLTSKCADCCDEKEVTNVGGMVAGVLHEDPSLASLYGPPISEPPITDQTAEQHDERRALIKAKIRDKGLSIGDERRS